MQTLLGNQAAAIASCPASCVRAIGYNARGDRPRTAYVDQISDER
jgi:hypothetical protein